MSHEPRANREYPFAECRYNGEIVRVTTLRCGPKGTPEVALQISTARMLAFSLVGIGVTFSLGGIGVAFRVGEAFAHRAHWANFTGSGSS